MCADCHWADDERDVLVQYRECAWRDDPGQYQREYAESTDGVNRGLLGDPNQGSAQTLTASVSNYTGNVVHVRYVNGVSAGTGSSFTFGSGTTVGYSYHIDVTAFTADGTQAGVQRRR